MGCTKLTLPAIDSKRLFFARELMLPETYQFHLVFVHTLFASCIRLSISAHRPSDMQGSLVITTSAYDLPMPVERTIGKLGQHIQLAIVQQLPSVGFQEHQEGMATVVCVAQAAVVNTSL